MPPSRTIPSTRTARRRVSPVESQAFADKFFMIDGTVHGWQYKSLYADVDVPEFPRPPKASIPRPKDPRPPPLTLQDLECVKTLGVGVYGQVLMVRTQRNSHPLDKPGTVFAMKVLRKKHTRALDQGEMVKKDIERSVLAELPWNPFVNGVVQTFYDHKNLYLMLELIPCGTLRSVIQKRAPLEGSQTAFYFANIACGLAFLEEHDIVHRDLKPENILMGADGYLCLADFGSAAREAEETDWLLVGTPTYMAPECIDPRGQTQDFGKAIDWWSSGCVLYEMITRKMPFYGRVQQSTFKKILSGNVEWPADLKVGKTLKSLVAGLLQKDAAGRLGGQGYKDVYKHPWLSKVEWDKMTSRQYLAPYVPPTPQLASTWHQHALPAQRRVPHLKVLDPPVHLAHDDRFPQRHVV